MSVTLQAWHTPCRTGGIAVVECALYTIQTGLGPWPLAYNGLLLATTAGWGTVPPPHVV